MNSVTDVMRNYTEMIMGLSKFQWEKIGVCRFCGGDMFWNEDEHHLYCFPDEPDCNCELKEEEDDTIRGDT